MGYSIMVEFPDVESRDKLLGFLKTNLGPIHELLGEDERWVRGPVVDPSYARRKAADRLIGFDFTVSASLQSRVAYLVCWWMCRRVPDSAFWYDGCDNWSVPEECDEHGFRTLATQELKTLERMRAREADAAHIAMFEEEVTETQKHDGRVHQALVKLTQAFGGMS